MIKVTTRMFTLNQEEIHLAVKLYLQEVKDTWLPDSAIIVINGTVEDNNLTASCSTSEIKEKI